MPDQFRRTVVQLAVVLLVHTGVQSLVRGALTTGELVVTTRLPEIGPGLQVEIK